MKIGYLSAFVLSQPYRWFPSVLNLRRSRGRGANFSRSVLGGLHHQYSRILRYAFSSNSLDSLGADVVSWLVLQPAMLRALSNSIPGTDGSVFQPAKRSCL